MEVLYRISSNALRNSILKTRTSLHALLLICYLFEKKVTLSDYLALDDGVMNTYFQLWMTSPDKILADLSQRFVNRKVFKSITFFRKRPRPTRNHETTGWRNRFWIQTTIPPFIRTLTSLMISIVPESENPRTQIEIIQKMENWLNSLACLLSFNPLLAAAMETTVSISRKKCWIKIASSQVLPSNFYTWLRTIILPQIRTNRGNLWVLN